MLNIIFFAFTFAAFAAGPEYPREVARWQEVTIPPKTDRAERVLWDYAANYSDLEWRVFADGERMCAELRKARVRPRESPPFTPAVGQFRGAWRYAAVDDGWLVAFNTGEFGAALYWFSKDGTRNYKISDDQVVDFLSLSDGLYAIEGLQYVHTGSLIRIARPQPGADWQAIAVRKLPSAPEAVSVRREGTMLITLSDALVSVGDDREIRTLLSDAPWSGILYPNSSVLSSDERKLYIGMRQFVGEFNLTTRKLRLLVPSRAFLNKLPKDLERQLRSDYGR
jgi:hypothetical protein